MSLSYLFDPNLQIQDDSGNNNVNGFLRVYIDGTDDRAVTYKDFNGTFNQADIRLDNNGRAVVIVDDTMTYRLEVYDRDGAMLWTQYPVKPSNTVINYGINNTYVMNADVRGTPDEIDVSSTTDQQTGFKTFFVKLSSTVKNFLSYVSNTLTSHGDAIGNLQNGKKDKQDEVAFNGSATKTVKKISQNENGVVSVEFEDIDSPPDVPNVDIVSPNNTIEVQSSTNVQTNTKTFTIDVKEKPLSLAWVESGNMTYSTSTSKLYTNVYSLLDLNNWQNPQGDKITYDPNTSKLWLAKGYYTIFSRLEITWEGTPQNKTISVGGNPFDLSYNHKASVGISALHQISATSAITITVDVSEQPPQGFTVKVKRADIYSVQQVMENVVQGLTEVHHDETLSGTGTEDDPLSVEGGGTEYTAGNGIDIINDKISAKLGRGLGFNSQGQIQTLLHDAGALTDAVSINVTNNATQQLTSAQAALTLNVNCEAGEVPNFAVEIRASAAITLTLTKTVNNVATTLYPSEAGGTVLELGKYYQVTCVGSCWTLAEFVPPTP